MYSMPKSLWHAVKAVAVQAGAVVVGEAVTEEVAVPAVPAEAAKAPVAVGMVVAQRVLVVVTAAVRLAVMTEPEPAGMGRAMRAARKQGPNMPALLHMGLV